MIEINNDENMNEEIHQNENKLVPEIDYTNDININMKDTLAHSSGEIILLK